MTAMQTLTASKALSSTLPTNYGETTGLKWLEQIEDSLTNLRMVLEAKAQRPCRESPIDFDSTTLEPSGMEDFHEPLRIVLVPPHSDGLDVRLPQPVVCRGTDDDEVDLQQAVAERNEYIAYLCSKIREMSVRIEAWLRLLQERSLTDETAVVLKDAEESVSQLVKAMEIELSIERAELARERNQLMAERRAFEEQVGRDRQRDSDSSTAPAGETPLLNRWRRFLTPVPRKPGKLEPACISGIDP